MGVVVVLGFATSARASGGDESELSSDLVQQSIALIANDAGAPRVLEKMGDALEAPDPSGVDLATVEQAVAIVEAAAGGPDEATQLAQARRLLVESTPQLATEPADLTVGLETQTTAVLDPFRPARGVNGTGDLVLLLLGLGAVGLGVFLSIRLRPTHSIRQLRHLGAPGATQPTPGRSDEP